jgi:HAD superfamily hydrolase (TIGR01509 family)
MMLNTVLFDWDGTLIDSAQQAFDAFRKSFIDLGLSLDFETYNHIYSPNWYRMYERLQLPRQRWEEADDLWLHHYAGEVPRLLSGGRSILAALIKKNYVLGIVTSGTRSRVEREIVALGLSGVFQVVICNEDVANKKPHPEGLEMALDRLQREPAACCYVGDCPDDIVMGRRANVLTIAIPSLYPASRHLGEAKPDFTFSSLSEFWSNLERGSLQGALQNTSKAQRL